MSSQLTEEEKKIIRYYEGDVSGTDPFWSDPKAYLTINSLFFPGIENEVARTDENKKLNQHFFDDDERVLNICSTLFRCGFKMPAPEEQTVYRVERYKDYQQMKTAGATISFTSTSTAGFLKQYSDRRGIALMKITVMPGVPCIDMEKALDYYAKSQEHEILLLPGSELEIEEKPLREEWMDIIDMDGQPPLLYSEIIVTGIRNDEPEINNYEFDRESLPRVYDRLNRHLIPDDYDIYDYIVYKQQFRHRLWCLLNSEII